MRNRWPDIQLICLFLIFTGFVSSRALISIGMIALLISSVFEAGFANLLRTFYGNRHLRVFSVFLLLVVFSGIYSSDLSEWLNGVRIKLPYLALPLAFAGMKNFGKRHFLWAAVGFCAVMTLSLLVISVNYGLHYETLTDGFLRGNTIPVPFSHIRYALMLCFSFFLALYLMTQQLFLFSAREKWLHLFFAVSAFAGLHVLSVRSGLLALYIGLLVLLLRYVSLRRQFLWGSLGVALIALLPVLAFKYVPSFHNKIMYMQYDLAQMRQGVVNYRYDAMRLTSMMAGIEVWKTHPLLGVGAGDLKQEMQRFYSENMPSLAPENRLLPHNQFIWVLTSTGIIGLMCFLFAFYMPLFARHNYRHWIFLVLQLLFFSSFFTEHTLEEQIGTGFYLITTLLLMHHFSHE